MRGLILTSHLVPVTHAIPQPVPVKAGEEPLPVLFVVRLMLAPVTRGEQHHRDDERRQNHHDADH